MESTKKCLNDWNVIVEALGQGKQTILIRKNITTSKEFLLFPTVSYLNNDNYLDSFKESEENFVKKFSLPNKKGNTYEIKYYAVVEDIIKTPVSRIGTYNDYHLWTREHVKGYLNSKHANVWLLRIYKLDESQYLKRSRGMVFANVNKEIELDYNNPVIDDRMFERLKEEILGK